MLMRIREQKGWIRGIFIVLILVFASSFVIGGVGSGSNFSLSDIIGNNGGSSSSTTNSSVVTSLLKQIKLQPKNGALYAQLSEAYQTDNRLERRGHGGREGGEAPPEQRRRAARRSPASTRPRRTRYNTQAQNLLHPGLHPAAAGSDAARRSRRSARRAPRRSRARSRTRSARTQSNTLSVQISALETQSHGARAKGQAANRRRSTSTTRSSTATSSDAQSWLSYATAAEQVGNNAVALRATRRSSSSCRPTRSPRRSRPRSSRSRRRSRTPTKKAAATTTTPDDDHALVTLASARVGDDGALVVVDGALDYHATEELADAARPSCPRAAPRRIAIDLERASPVDDATIGVLFRALRAARDAGGALAIGGAGAPAPRRARDDGRRSRAARRGQRVDALQGARAWRRRTAGRIPRRGPLAQLVEQGTLNPKVEGSIPSRPIVGSA